MLIDRINDQAQVDYRQKTYDGKIILFKPKKHYAEFNDPEYGWGKLAKKGVKVIDMPVYPRGVLNEPFVQILAGKLRKEIVEANNNSR